MGNGRGEMPLLPGLASPAIDHNELVASARSVTFDVQERDFPTNRSPPRWKFVCRPKRKIVGSGVLASALLLDELRVHHLVAVRGHVGHLLVGDGLRRLAVGRAQ